MTVITSTYEGTCRKCGGRIAKGEQIEWEKGQGSSHVECPEHPEVVVPTERTARFKKLDDDVFGIVVTDPTDATGLKGQPVTVRTRAGRESGEVLGEMVSSSGPYEAVYRKAELPDEDVVPAGCYAIDVLDQAEGRNDVMFVKVWRRAGRVRVFLQLGPDKQGRQLNTGEYLQRIIAAGVAESALRYGQLLRRCSRCNAELTNRLSRALNIGPVCGGHYYPDEAWASIKKQTRQDLIVQGLDPTETHSTEMWARLESGDKAVQLTFGEAA